MFTDRIFIQLCFLREEFKFFLHTLHGPYLRGSTLGGFSYCIVQLHTAKVMNGKLHCRLREELKFFLRTVHGSCNRFTHGFVLRCILCHLRVHCQRFYIIVQLHTATVMGNYINEPAYHSMSKLLCMNSKLHEVSTAHVSHYCCPHNRPSPIEHSFPPILGFAPCNYAFNKYLFISNYAWQNFIQYSNQCQQLYCNMVEASM